MLSQGFKHDVRFRTALFILLIPGCVFASIGCSSVKTTFNKNVEPYPIEKIAVLRSKKSDISDGVYNRYISYFLEDGFDVVERRQLVRIAQEEGLTENDSGNSDDRYGFDNALRLAQLAKADALFFIAGEASATEHTSGSIRMTGTKNGKVIAVVQILPGEEATANEILTQLVQKLKRKGWTTF